MNQADAHFAGWLMCAVCKGKLATTPKIPMTVLSRRCAEFGVRIAVSFRCSLSKVTENGNNLTIQNLACRQSTRS